MNWMQNDKEKSNMNGENTGRDKNILQNTTATNRRGMYSEQQFETEEDIFRELKKLQSDKRRFNYRLKKVLVTGLLAGLLIGTVFSVILSVGNSRKAREYENEIAALENENKKLTGQASLKTYAATAASQNAETLASEEEGWALVLINEAHPLDTAYVPELSSVNEEQSVDARIAGPLSEMLSDAAEAGMDMYVLSSYRSYETQREVFNTTMQEWILQGYSPLDAYDETRKSVAVPGTSEHASGLALDIVSSQYDGLDDKQAETQEAKWLEENCWKYGFILRYPPEKSDITGIVYEPWHYRYVGKEAAEEIMKQDITLEEYIENKN